MDLYCVVCEKVTKHCKICGGCQDDNHPDDLNIVREKDGFVACDCYDYDI